MTITDNIIDIETAQAYCVFGDRRLTDVIDETRRRYRGKDEDECVAAAVAKAAGAKNGKREISEFAPPAALAVDVAIPAVITWLGAVMAAVCAKNATGGGFLNVQPGTAGGEIRGADDYAYQKRGGSGNMAIIRDTPAVGPTPAVAPVKDSIPTVGAEQIEKILKQGNSSEGEKSSSKKTWIAVALSALGSIGTGISSMFTAVAAATGLTVNSIAAIMSALMTVATYLTPRFWLWMKRSFRGGVVALTRFTVNGKDEIDMFFSGRDFRWHMEYRGSRLLSPTKVSQDMYESMLRTEYFGKFRNKCVELTERILGNKTNLNILAAVAASSKNEQIISDATSMFIHRRKIIEGLKSNRYRI